MRQAFRTEEGVDVKALGSSGYYIGWTNADEYLRYTVDVQETGETSRRLYYVHFDACYDIGIPFFDGKGF